MKNLKLILSCLVCIMLNIKANAQCSAPTGAVHTTTTATCATNGVITVGAVTGGAGLSLEYALYNAANSTVIKPYQLSNIFTDLPAATYTLRVRYTCSGGGVSTAFTKPLTVASSYITPSISSITVQRRASCNNGRFSVSATGGTAPYTYALVSSMGELEPIATYVKGPQSSNIFDSMVAGTYYVRLYDACGSYYTSSVTINSITGASVINSYIEYGLCDSLSLVYTISNPGDYVPGTADTSRRHWVVFPDGSTSDSLGPDIGIFGERIPIPLAKLGAATGTSSTFPDTYTWPKDFVIGYKDACGNIYTRTHTLQRPTINYTVGVSGTSGYCDSVAYRINYASTPIGNISNVYLRDNLWYSKDGGSTWVQAVAGGTGYSGSFNLEAGAIYSVMIAVCGDTVTRTGTANAIMPLSAELAEVNLYSCVGNSGIQFRASPKNPITVEMLSGPAGQSFTTSTITAAYTWTWLDSKNMLPGSYTFRFTDDCGRTANRSINLTHPYVMAYFEYSYPCGSTNLHLNMTNYRYWNQSYSTSISYNIKARIYDLSGTPVSGTGSRLNDSTYYLPASAYSSLADGDYIIRMWKDSADVCAFVEKPFTKNSTLISLSRSTVMPSCSDPGLVTIIGIAQGGSGVYSFSLYENSVSTANLVAGPQLSNVFTELSPSITYVLTVNDTCGRGTQVTLSYAANSLTPTNNVGGIMPCLGDNLELNIQEISGMSYQWYKNDVLVPGATLPTFSLFGISTADSGNYKVEIITDDTCSIVLSAFDLDPANCGVPLPVELISFDVYSDKGCNVTIAWASATESAFSHYEIERSTDGRVFPKLVEVKAKGNSSEYKYIDAIAGNGHYFYRLKMVDLDGKFQYSNVQFINASCNGSSISLFPNPVHNLLTVKGLKGGELMLLFSVDGRLIKSINNKNTSADIDLTALKAGVYIFTVKSNTKEVQTFKVLKK